MSEARSHEPKLGALRAHREGKLSAAGRARIEQHLAGCETCCEARAGMQRYETLLGIARGAPAPELDFAHMDAVLAREAARLARKRQIQRVARPLALAAVACLAFVAMRASREPAPSPRPAQPDLRAAPAVPSQARALAVHITAIVGAPRALDEVGQPVLLTLDTMPREGWILETPARSELHFVLEDGAALLIPAGARIRLDRVRPDEVQIALLRGRVVNAVQPLGPNRRYAIAAAGYAVEVRGTHFAVEHLEPGLGVQVDEGAVAVSRGGVLVAEVRAPGRWRGAGALAAPGADERALRRPRAPAGAFETWPALQIPPWPQVVGWEIDGAALIAADELRMRVPPGALALQALLESGRRVPVQITVDPLGTRFDPRALQLRPRHRAGSAQPEAGTPDAAQAAAVIRAAQPALQRCYERSLRRASHGALRARLRLQIDARGNVSRAELRAEQGLPVPATFAKCVRGVAQRWRFEAPGGSGITFDAPLAFQTRN